MISLLTAGILTQYNSVSQT